MFEESLCTTNNICIFLGMSNDSVYKDIYLVCVFVFINGLCFLTMMAIYVQIVYLQAQSSKQAGRGMDLNLLKRILLIVFTNLLCWIPLSTYILCAYNGITPLSDVTVWIVILVLPINSAANPVLYTLSATCKVYMRRFNKDKK